MSVDTFLGLPFNIASYALLAHILARLCGCTAKKLVFTGGDTHIYNNHMDAVNTMLGREIHPLPMLILPEFSSLEELLLLDVKDFVLENYQSSGTITAPMAV